MKTKFHLRSLLTWDAPTAMSSSPPLVRRKVVEVRNTHGMVVRLAYCAYPASRRQCSGISGSRSAHEASTSMRWRVIFCFSARSAATNILGR